MWGIGWSDGIPYTQLQLNLHAKVPLIYVQDAAFCVLFENNIAE